MFDCVCIYTYLCLSVCTKSVSIRPYIEHPGTACVHVHVRYNNIIDKLHSSVVVGYTRGSYDIDAEAKPMRLLHNCRGYIPQPNYCAVSWGCKLLAFVLYSIT